MNENMCFLVKCTSLLAVSTTVGFLDLRKVSNSSELDSFCSSCPYMLLNRLRSLAPLVFLKSARALRFLRIRILNVVLSEFLSLYIFSPNSMLGGAGASFLVQGLHMRSFTEFWRARTALVRRTLLDNSSRWTLSFPNFNLVPLEIVDRVFWSQSSLFT